MQTAASTEPTAVARDRSEGAIEVFFRLADAWGLDTNQQLTLLGSPGRSTFFKWKKEGGSVSADTEERISHLISIYKDLNILTADEKMADEWIKRPNRYFDGKSALDVMLEGKLSDIYRVRAYLDAERGG